MDARNAIQESYKKVFYFKQLFDEVISLSFFTEDISKEDKDRIVLLGDVMDKELHTKQGIVRWFKRKHSVVWDSFNKKSAIECAKILTDKQRILYNQLGYIKYVSQWWESNEVEDNEPSDKFLNRLSTISNNIDKNYSQYCRELNNKKD